MISFNVGVKIPVNGVFSKNYGVSFHGNSSLKSDDINCTDQFKSSIPEGYSINDLIDLAQKPKNQIGMGANSVVYNIPLLDDYVLKVLNKDDPNNINIKEFPSSVNLGQPVWQNPDNLRMLILKKINGNEHSIPNWSNTIWDNEIYSPRSVTKEQAKLYFSQISDIALFPQSSYDSFAADTKLLSDKGYKLDSINPNNLIVDNKKKQLHVIDYFKVKPKESDIYQNSYLDLSAIILDFTLLPEFYDNLDKDDQKELVKNIKIINEKTHQAALNTGLSTDEDRFKTYIRTTSRWFTAHSVNKENGMYFRYYDVRLDDFIKMLKNPDKWANER